MRGTNAGSSRGNGGHCRSLGCGQEYLVALMGGLDRPSQGAICYKGTALQQLRDEQLADFRNQHVGFIFQSHHLLPEFSALENTMLPALIQRRPKHKAREDAQQLLVSVGLGDRIHHRPSELSGGEATARRCRTGFGE